MGFFKICVFLLLIMLFVSSSGDSSNGLLSSNSLDSVIRDYAFKSLVRARTGVLCKPSVPAKLFGVKIAVARFKSGSFWSRGANFSSFDIPPRVLIKPNVMRFALVYQNLANWSSSYFTVPGYFLAAPVVGFLAYNASNLNAVNIQELEVRVNDKPILVRFSGIAMLVGSASTAKCVRFGTGQSVYFSNMTAPGVCSTMHQGHFSIVVPEIASGPSPTGLPEKKKEMTVSGITIGGGICGLVLLGLIVIVLLRLKKKKKITEMEEKADQEENLENVMVGNNRMPAATVTRTQPIIENGNAP